MDLDTKDQPTVGSLLRDLGYDPPGNNLDEALRWALIELKLRREGRCVSCGKPVDRNTVQFVETGDTWCCTCL